MSALDGLGLEEAARQLRDPSGPTGLAVADMLDGTNRQGNLQIVGALKPESGASVLEVGCGTGSMARVVVERFGDASYAGLDSSPTMIEAARARNADLLGKGRVSFHLARVERMPFAGSTFDRVFSIGLIHFWAEPVETLREVRRVMRPGGLMLMGGLGPERAPPFARSEYGFHLHGVAEWEGFCQEAGFEKVEVLARTLGSEGGPQLIQVAARAP